MNNKFKYLNLHKISQRFNRKNCMKTETINNKSRKIFKTGRTLVVTIRNQKKLKIRN